MSDYASSRSVRQQIRWYQHNQDHLNHIIAEAAPYIYYIYQQTQQRHLPAELALIPVIESEYNPYAKSRSGALGLWQMMPGTAHGFGLKKDYYYDGRKDVVASTHAALEYFTYLHEYFNNNWLLAIAAYDCGEGTVTACMRYNRFHHRATDFWNLPLPYETQAYVPRLLAVAAIVKNPSRYGIHLAPIGDTPFVESVDVGSPIELSKVAKLADVPLDTMKALNPGVQHGKTDPHGPYTILVPKNKAETFKERLAALTHNEKILWQQHIVKSKETLEKIAEKYRTTVALLKQANGLKSNHVHTNQTLLIPPTTQAPKNATPNNNTGDSTPILANNTATTSATVAAIPTTKTYTVKAGDDLWHIAAANNVNITDLLAWNNLTLHHKLQTGEKLVIQQNNTPDQQPQKVTPPPTLMATAQAINTTTKTNTTEVSETTTNPTTTSENLDNDSATKTPTNSQKLPVTYKVASGDSLRKIAETFHVSITQLKHANNLTSNVLQPGEILTIPNHESTITNSTHKTQKIVAEKKAKIYTVRHGDYVEKIAKRFDVSPQDIRKWNHISGKEIIQPGQKLTIHADA
jgi:membrane-bound lytic murein transglycosylase D